MNAMRQLYDMLMAGTMRHARWEYETSMNILRSKKRMLLVAMLTIIPMVIYGLCFAGDDTLPKMLGEKTAYSPAFYELKIFLVTIAIGLCAGLITGCIGAGGGFIITPALMSAGIKGILAVGTDLFHIFAKAIMGTVVHKKLGNVNVPLAVAFLVGSILGVLVGGEINRTLYDYDPLLSEVFISGVYVVLLGFLGFYSLTDFVKLKRAGGKVDSHGHVEGASSHDQKKGLPATLQGMNIPPMIKFDEDLYPGGKKISGVFVAACGAFVGLVAAIMGVGGGFITFPAFVYVLGVSSFTTVGTDILQIIFTAGFAAFTQYALYGYIFYTLAMGMLLGSLIGIQIGALTTKIVPGIYIRGFYATAILAGFANRLFALPPKLVKMKWIDLSPAMVSTIDMVGQWIFFIAVGIFGGWIIFTFLANLGKLREE